MKRGFTLVELIVVVIIIGILAAVGLPQYRKAMEKARGAEGYAGLGFIQEAEKIYYADHDGVYYAGDPSGSPKGNLTFDNMTVLDINLRKEGWNFYVTCPGDDCKVGFNATAVRKAGPCPATCNTLAINETGAYFNTSWADCVANGLKCKT